MKRMLITETERDQIKSLYGLYNNDNSIVITEWLSPDEKYCIFFDDLIDIQNKVKIGNIWENFDNFKFFLKHSFEVASNIPKEIKESVLYSINSILITESNQNMVGLKPYVKQLLEQEWTADPFKSDFYTKNNWSNALEAGKNKINSTWEGLKKIHKNIKDNEWKEAFKIIGQGVLYVARTIRSALYNPIGIVLDAILIATGIGKGFQVLIWSVVVLLDVYELSTGNFEDKDVSLGWRLLFFGIDILGLVTAGAAAKAAKSGALQMMSKYGKNAEGLNLAVKESPALKTTCENILKSLSSADGILQQSSKQLQKKSPKIYNFLSGSIKFFKTFLNKLINLLKGLLNVVGKVLNAPGKAIEKLAPISTRNSKLVMGTSAAATQIVPMAGAHVYSNYKYKQQMDDFANTLASSDVIPIYDPSQL